MLGGFSRFSRVRAFLCLAPGAQGSRPRRWGQGDSSRCNLGVFCVGRTCMARAAQGCRPRRWGQGGSSASQPILSFDFPMGLLVATPSVLRSCCVLVALTSQWMPLPKKFMARPLLHARACLSPYLSSSSSPLRSPMCKVSSHALPHIPRGMPVRASGLSRTRILHECVRACHGYWSLLRRESLITYRRGRG